MSGNGKIAGGGIGWSSTVIRGARRRRGMAPCCNAIIIPEIADFSIPNPTFSDGGSFSIPAPFSLSPEPFTYTSSDTSIATVADTTVTILQAGDFTITAAQPANRNYASSSRTVAFSINKSTPVITNFSIPNQTYSGGTFTITAPTSTSPVAFSYTSSNPSIATVSGSTVTILQAGTVTITATQASNRNYLSRSATASFTINRASTTITNFSIPNQTFSSGATFSITDPSSNSIGAFSYTSSNLSVATVSGNTVTMVQAGAVTITVTQAETTNYLAATANASFSIVNTSPTISSFTIPTRNFSNGGTFSLTAPSSNSSGAFSYTSSDTSIATVSGSTVTMLQAGTITITANQAASSPYSSGSVTASLLLKEPTLVRYIKLYFRSNPNFINFSQLAVYSNGVNIAPGKTTTAANTIGNGTNKEYPIDGSLTNRLDQIYHSVNPPSLADFWQLDLGATYPIDSIVFYNRSVPNNDRALGMTMDTYAVTPSSTNYINRFTLTDGLIQTFTILPPPTITNFSIPNQIYVNGATFSITDPSSNGTGAFSYTSSNTSIATISGSTVTMLQSGTITITATQAATATNETGRATASVTLINTTPVITNFSIPTQNFVSGGTFTITTPTSSSPGAFSYTSSDPSIATVAGSTVTMLQTGTVTITANQAASTPYLSGSATASLTIAVATNLRYIKLYFLSSPKIINFSQLAVYSNGVNIAPGKTTSQANSYGEGSTKDKPIDGSLTSRAFPNVYHSAAPASMGDFWQLDLGQIYPVTSIVFYNRDEGDSNLRAVGMTMDTYDATPFTTPLTRFTLTGDLIQTFSLLV